MSILENISLYLRRCPVRTLLVSFIIAAVLSVELLGLGLNTTSAEGREYAYIYNGFALGMYDEGLYLTEEDYDAIEQIEHVTGVGGHFMEMLVTPDNACNVKEHTGVTPAESEASPDGSRRAEQMVLVAIVDIPMYEVFRRDRSVLIIDGTYPDEENGGVLIESRFAALNDIAVGDALSLHIDEMQKDIAVDVSGIFYVDTEFEILETNTQGDGAYIYSPYNHIYIEYMYASELVGFKPAIEHGCNVYVDSAENVGYVKNELRKIVGEAVEISDNTTNYLERGNGVIGVLGGLSKIICLLTLVLGSVLLLILFSFFFISFRKDVGIYMAFGESRGKCLIRYMAMQLTYTIIGAVVFAILWLLLSDPVVRLVNMQLMDAAYGGYSGQAVNSIYRMSNYNRSFSILIEKKYIFNADNFLRILGTAGGCFIVSCIIPLYSVLKASPKQLMNSAE